MRGMIVKIFEVRKQFMDDTQHIWGTDGTYNAYRAYLVIAVAQGAVDFSLLGSMDNMEQTLFNTIKQEHDAGIDRYYDMPSDV